MRAASTDLGTADWTERTSGQLTPADRRSMFGAVARRHAGNTAGRVSMFLHVNSGRRAEIDPSELAPPSSELTRAAEAQARRRLGPALLNHSYRTYAFGAAVAALENLDFDRELLFAAALLHDTGLPTPTPHMDFTLRSARIAREVAARVGLSTAATEILRTAITLHHSPDVRLSAGPVAYLLSAGAGIDVIGIRSWQLPPAVLDAVLTQHPRVGFKREFRSAFRAEAKRVPEGRAKFLRRYAAFDLAIRLAPFKE